MATVKKKSAATAATRKRTPDPASAGAPSKKAAAPKKTAVRKSPAKAAIKKAPPRKAAASRVRKSPGAEPAPSWLACVRAAQDKKAESIVVLDLREVTSMADFFLLCNGTNPRQNQAIAGEIEQVMKLRGEFPSSVEGFENAEWILLDYGDLVCHVFTEQARGFYDLDRLWRDAASLPIPA